MEAPEKIYLPNNPVLFISNLNERTSEDDIEYTQTDAFIEKVEEHLKTQFIKDVSVLAGGVVNINFSAAIKNFEDYMKGK